VEGVVGNRLPIVAVVLLLGLWDERERRDDVEAEVAGDRFQLGPPRLSRKEARVKVAVDLNVLLVAAIFVRLFLVHACVNDGSLSDR
jgi:hypothetical protein